MSTQHTKTMAMFIDASRVAKANTVFCALGYDAAPGNSFPIALSPDGAAPATAYGNTFPTTQAIANVIAAAQAGTLPSADWSSAGLTEDDASDIFAHLVASVGARKTAGGTWNDDGSELAALLTANELRRVARSEVAGVPLRANQTLDGANLTLGGDNLTVEVRE